MKILNSVLSAAGIGRKRDKKAPEPLYERAKRYASYRKLYLGQSIATQQLAEDAEIISHK